MKSLFSRLMPKLEMVVTAFLFFAMLISCGLYLNVKMNGNKSALPELPEKDRRMIMRSVNEMKISFDDDLIEPVFVGVKDGDKMVAAIPDDNSRRTIEASVYSPITSLFSGTSNEIVFDNKESKMAYIDDLKSSERYMLICFYGDLPSSVFLPCITNGFENESNVEAFNIRSMFLLPDENSNLYAVAISSEYDLNVLYPNEEVPFNKISAQTYDVSDGWSYFDYSDYVPLMPELTNSLVLPKYQISPLSSIYGKTNESKLVNTCFELFSVNRNLVKNYSSNDGHTENFVDEISEISFSDFGIVEYRALDGYGINLDKYLGYLPDDGMNYSFEDKIFAVKRIINELDFHNDNISYCISGLEYDERKNTLTIYFKFVCDGILISDAEYHALFEIANNGLVHARFNAVTCSRTNDFVSLIPQRYANMILHENGETTDDYVIMPVMFDMEDNSPYKTVKWAKISSSPEVIE